MSVLPQRKKNAPRPAKRRPPNDERRQRESCQPHTFATVRVTDLKLINQSLPPSFHGKAIVSDLISPQTVSLMSRCGLCRDGKPGPRCVACILRGNT